MQLPTLEQARPHCPHGPLIAPCPAPVRDLVRSLQRRLRMAHMSWIPERAALLLDKVAEPAEPEG